jgi:hypothetical protein
MPERDAEQVRALLVQFDGIVEGIFRTRNLRRAMVRSLLLCDVLVFLDRSSLFMVAQRAKSELTSARFFSGLDLPWDAELALDVARWDFGYDDPFIVMFPREIVFQEPEQRRLILESIASAHVESEVQRVNRLTSVITITPVFGPASYALDDRLCFVIMPFSPTLGRIYESIVKLTVEQEGLVCRRADDFKTNRVIIQDIWKAICEARLIIADLTGLNPNVMYELGMAHTVGKETIMIYQRQRGRAPKFPFDIGHMRRIEYVNSAPGGKQLERDLEATIKGILTPVAANR